MTSARKNGRNTVGGRDPTGRFVAGNGGRPRGSRNRVSLAVEAIVEGKAKAITDKAVELALAGDAGLIRALLDRLAPPRRDRPVKITAPTITTAADVAPALSAILAAATAGEITPAEARELASVIAQCRQAIELGDLETRIADLEAGAGLRPRP